MARSASRSFLLSLVGLKKPKVVVVFKRARGKSFLCITPELPEQVQDGYFHTFSGLAAHTESVRICVTRSAAGLKVKVNGKEVTPSADAPHVQVFGPMVDLAKEVWSSVSTLARRGLSEATYRKAIMARLRGAYAEAALPYTAPVLVRVVCDDCQRAETQRLFPAPPKPPPDGVLVVNITSLFPHANFLFARMQRGLVDWFGEHLPEMMEEVSRAPP